MAMPMAPIEAPLADSSMKRRLDAVQGVTAWLAGFVAPSKAGLAISSSFARYISTADQTRERQTGISEDLCIRRPDNISRLVKLVLSQ
ncbi:hypothetical protein LshimejAT787_0601030 [Lyophyllum shimeji]|uniref:Uncharacterized protein n=1 Tax=Lyophyllum shimeji TaxID=47721 RepID=A0A9P3PPB7_LYOSH|nr:hypothetical protein LshimejAT787_0601030 [Lyophyllum shimeji]